MKQSSPEPKSESSWEYYTESDPEPDEPAPAKVDTPAPKVEPVTKESLIHEQITEIWWACVVYYI